MTRLRRFSSLPGALSGAARPVAVAVALWAALLAGLPGRPPAAQAREVLRVRDVALDARAERFELRTWEGRPAVSVFTLRLPGDGTVALAVHTVVLDAEGWRSVGRWTLPIRTRWVEPLHLPGGADGWLLLVKEQWRIAVPEGETLRMVPLCTCSTIYSHGGVPDPERHRFVHDLDGDGVQEVVLPYSGHLEAYRITPGLLAPEPLWRVNWHTDGTPLPRARPAEQGFVLPAISFPDVDGDGRPELFIEGDAAVQVAPLPAAEGPQRYGIDGPRRALLQRRAAGNALPATLLEAVRRLGDRRFESAQAFLAALAEPATPEQAATWAPHLMDVLALARSAVPVVQPYRVPLAGLGTFGEADRALLLGHTDMDGDGVLDLLHAKLLNFGSVLSQENELRWYRGRIADGRLAFAPPTDALKTDAGSFADVARLRTDDAPPLALLTATAEVSLGSIMKALASQSVTLQARVLLWGPGALLPNPIASGEFTYSDLKAPGRRAMFLFADLDGDGWRDYVLNLKRGELTVFLSAGGPPHLDKAAVVQDGLPLPGKPEKVLIADLDGDGREELVLRYDVKHHGELGRKLRVVQLVTE